MGEAQVSTEHSGDIPVLCNNAIVKEKRKKRLQYTELSFVAFSLPFPVCCCQNPALTPCPVDKALPCWLQPVGTPGGQGMIHSRAGGQRPSQQQHSALLAGTCSRRCAAQDVVAVLLLSLLPTPASLAGKSTTFPTQTPGGGLQGSTLHFLTPADSSGQVSLAKTPAWERSTHILLSPLVLVCEPEHAGLGAAP